MAPISEGMTDPICQQCGERASSDTHTQGHIPLGARACTQSRLDVYRLALAEAQADSAKMLDILDCGTNALLDSILASGNDATSNLHWVRKMRRDSGIEPASRQPDPAPGGTENA